MGHTVAFFQDAGTTPDWNDLFSSLVIDGVSDVAHSLRILPDKLSGPIAFVTSNSFTIFTDLVFFNLYQV